jgi:hypothetical protein
MGAGASFAVVFLITAPVTALLANARIVIPIHNLVVCFIIILLLFVNYPLFSSLKQHKDISFLFKIVTLNALFCQYLTMKHTSLTVVKFYKG